MPFVFRVWKYTPNSAKIINFSILLFAIIGGGAATISAMNAMINSELSPPCYAGLFVSQKPIEGLNHELFPINSTIR
jgi:hypothetical protein